MIEKFANKMDTLFELKKLVHPLIKLGYYFNPRQKIEFFVEKFIELYELNKNTEHFKKNGLPIKINDQNVQTVMIKFAGNFFFFSFSFILIIYSQLKS